MWKQEMGLKVMKQGYIASWLAELEYYHVKLADDKVDTMIHLTENNEAYVSVIKIHC